MPRKKLTAKQQKFVEVFTQTKNGSEAIRQAYDVEGASPNTVAVMASENLSKPNIIQKIEELRSIMAEDSYWMYSTQKDILKTAISANNLELANKIVNKVIDRAGLMPVYKSESKHITAKFNFKRGNNQ